MKSKGELTRTRIISEATQLVRRKGFDATSINDLMVVTGLKKGCLYFHFAGKEDLSLAILEKAKADFFSSFDSLEEETPDNRLDRLFDAALTAGERDGFECGCIFGNTALEMSGGKNERLAKFVGDFFAEWIERVSKVVKDAQKAGQVRKDLSSATLAKHIVMSLEGGMMLARLEKSEKPLRDCIKPLRVLLGMKK